MNATNAAARPGAGLQTPVRNRYFYGKLLDVHHCELETTYLNAKRWMLNRTVLGWGVVCGLDVEPGPDPDKIVIGPGVAIDPCGRELVVPVKSGPILIPPEVIADALHAHDGSAEDAGPCLHVLLCYHECEADPAPVLAGDCDTSQACEPGSIREQYRVVFRPGWLSPTRLECRIRGAIRNGQVNYAALASWVTRACPRAPDDLCIPLANIWLAGPEGHRCDWEDIDITVRRIAFTNRLLFDLLLCQTEEPGYDSQRDDHSAHGRERGEP